MDLEDLLKTNISLSRSLCLLVRHPNRERDTFLFFFFLSFGGGRGDFYRMARGGSGRRWSWIR